MCETFVNYYIFKKHFFMKRFFITLLLSFSLSVLFGQSDMAIDSALLNISKQLIFFPHEKIYLHTDKPYYITGEKIYFRAFLLDALTNEQTSLSRYVYVELISPIDTVVSRVKIRPDEENLFYGVIPIPGELPQGTYKIRAYTQYMANQGESAYFTKYVKIGDPGILSVHTEADFQFTASGRINGTLRFINPKTQEVIEPKEVIFKMNHQESFRQRPDRDGNVRFNLRVPDNSPKRTLYVELTTDQRIYRQYIRLPYPEGDFDVSFYPEGGHLIAGQSSVVAFKAVNTSGASLQIEGEVQDSKGNTVAELQTIHEGMGQLSFIPKPDERYHAVCRACDKTQRFDLPEVQTDAIALKAFVRDRKLWISLKKGNQTPIPALYLLIHSRGFVNYAKEWDAAKEYIAFDVSVFSSGINHLVLMTKDMQVVSERLIFLLNDDDFGEVALQTDRDSYGRREPVQAGIQLKDAQQQPVKGNFSIAVTNDTDIIPDTTKNILSEILLCSELKGAIENAAYYFRKGDKEAELAADLLMRTHGWTRYAIPAKLRGEITHPAIPFETAHDITGTVKSGLLAKPVKDYKVSIVSTEKIFIYDETTSDENGRFVLRGYEFPDSAKVVIQAIGNKDKGERMTELYVDEQVFPTIKPVWKESMVFRKREEEGVNYKLRITNYEGDKKEEEKGKERGDQVFLNYVTKADRQYTSDTGIREYNLPEVNVTAKQIERHAKSYIPYSVTNSIANISYTKDYLQNFPAKTTLNLLYSLVKGIKSTPAINDSRDNWFRTDGSMAKKKIIIDDMVFYPHDLTNNEYEMLLNSFPVEDIEHIDILIDGPIIIYTNQRGAENYKLTPNVKRISPLGYQAPVAFYSPKYDTQEQKNNPKPDLRTIIYWKANVVTDDAGQANLDFYTADDPTTYTVIIEGVSDDGRLIHYKTNSLITVK